VWLSIAFDQIFKPFFMIFQDFKFKKNSKNDTP